MTGAMSLTDLEAVLIEEFELILEVNGITRESNFFVCGGDSLTALELVAHLNSRYGLNNDMEDLPLWSSISEIAAWLVGRLPLSAGRPTKLPEG